MLISGAKKRGSAKRILVVSGGLSAEREVSLISGKECSNALRESNHTVREFDFTTLREFLKIVDDFQPDLVFNALHGTWGEGGPFQGVLDTIDIPYTHSGLLPSAIAMNKHLTKNLLSQENIPTPFGSLILENELQSVALSKLSKCPLVIKPNSQGSSIGVGIVYSADDLERFLKLIESNKTINATHRSHYYILEDYIPGRELTTALLDDTPLGVTEILTDGWYDYDAKYKNGGSKHIVPANIPESILQLCKDYASVTHRLIGCKGVSRVDFRWNETLGSEGLFVLEINTQPGMTPTSLLPEQAMALGISFQELCNWIVEDASCFR